MLAHVREPLLLVSRSGVILAGNVGAAEALATTMSALVGSLLSVHAAEPSDLDVRIIEASNEDAAIPLCTRDGRRFTCHASVLDQDLLLVRLSGGPDPATRARAFFEMMPRLEGLARSGPSTTLEELSSTMLRFGMTSVGAKRAAMYWLDEDGHTLELIAALDYPEELRLLYRLISMGTSLPLTDCVRDARPYFLLTREEYEEREPGFFERHRFVEHASACLPMVLDGKRLGAIVIAADYPWDLADGDRAFLLAFSMQCAQSLERANRSALANTQRDLEVAAERLERLHGFTGALARAMTPADLAEAALDAGMAATGARSGGLWLVDDDGRTVSLVRSVGPTGPRPEHHSRVPIDRPTRMPILDAIQSRTSVWIESCRQLEVRYPEAFRAFSRGGGDTSLACVPLLAQGRCIGALAFNFDHAHRFLEHERAFFQMITWYAAQALERARLYAAEQRARTAAEARQRRTAFLAESDTLLASLDYESVLSAIAAIAVPRIADWCIVEIEEERLQGKPPIALHVDPLKTPFLLKLCATFRERDDAREHGTPAVIRTGRSLLYRSITPDTIRNTVRDREVQEQNIESGVVSSMVVPITARGKTLGAILLSSANPSRLYDENDLAMAEELGRKIGLAIENARLYRETREADQLKDEFLAMLSHELRNPLVPIVAAVDLMSLHDSDQFIQERDLIQRNAQHLVRLVDDLLDVSRITRGKISLSKQRCEIADIVRDAIDLAFPMVQEANHRLLVAAPRRGLAVLADRVRIGQAVANLLTNAAKYTEPGGTITVTAEAEAGNAVIRVRDDGLGIAPDVLPRIFDMFVQAPDAQLTGKGGLGIGLTIVKRLVELHEGTVTATSAGLGQGSEFAITLPLTTAALPVAHRPPPMTRVDGDRRVLVVDDNEDAAAAIADLMRAIGFTAHIAHDGFAALDAATKLEPDLALLDLGLPKMDGYELARRLRAMSPKLRIVAVTGFGQPSDRQRSQEAGFDEHIVKPVTLDLLRKLVASR